MASAKPYGLKVCHTAEDALVDIVFVHSLTGNRINTWTEKGSGVFWPGDLLKDDIPKSRILTFGYDADVAHFWSETSQNRIGNHALNFLNALTQLRERSETDQRPLLFVAHSLGGLVFEDTLLSSRNSAEPHLKRLAESTIGVCFLGVPHCGSDLASWANLSGKALKIATSPNKSLISTLEPESETLARIQRDFHSMLRSRSDQGLPLLQITCFFEELRVKGIGEIVPKHSAILPAYNHIGIHANHIEMTKFSGAEDEGYLAVSSELMRWVRGIKTMREQQEMQQAIARQQFSQNPAFGYSHAPNSVPALPPITPEGMPRANQQTGNVNIMGQSAGGKTFAGNNYSVGEDMVFR